MYSTHKKTHPNTKGIIAIGAHPDDIELGCGASLARLINDGYHVVAVVMTQGTAGCDDNINRHDESRNSLQSLGCQQIFHLHFEDTQTQYHIDRYDQVFRRYYF